jgi:hypothetical protein
VDQGRGDVSASGQVTTLAAYLISRNFTKLTSSPLTTRAR